MRAIVAEAEKAAKAALWVLFKPALYGLNTVLNVLMSLRDILSLLGSTLRSALSWRLMALPSIVYTGQ